MSSINWNLPQSPQQNVIRKKQEGPWRLGYAISIPLLAQLPKCGDKKIMLSIQARVFIRRVWLTWPYTSGQASQENRGTNMPKLYLYKFYKIRLALIKWQKKQCEYCLEGSLLQVLIITCFPKKEPPTSLEDRWEDHQRRFAVNSSVQLCPCQTRGHTHPPKMARDLQKEHPLLAPVLAKAECVSSLGNLRPTCRAENCPQQQNCHHHYYT